MDKRYFGNCRKVHGIKGGLCFNLLNPKNSILKIGSKIWIEGQNGQKQCVITGISFGNKVIAYLDQVSSRDEAESLIPFDIYVDRDCFPKLMEDEFYLDDLVGALVFEDEKDIGKISGHYSNGVQDIFEIKLNNGQKIDLPLVEDFFVDIDIAKKRVQVIRPSFI